MNICSLVVHPKPELLASIQSQLTALPGVEIHGGQAEGKLIVTVEDADDQLAADTLHDIQRMEGVLNASLIYHRGDA